MFEIAAAVLAPPLALLLLTWAPGFDADLRRAVRRWFVPLVVLWLAPFWTTGRGPAPLDYLAEQVWPWAATGVQSGNPLLSDVPLQFLPWREIVSAAYRDGELPLLDRHAGSGSFLWENPQAAVLYPLTLLGLPFSTFAWPLFAAAAKLLVALTGACAFLLAHRASYGAAVFGAIAYGCGAFTLAFLLFPHTNVTVLLPWLLLAIDRAVVSRRGAAVFAAALFLVFSGGHPESVLHAAMLAVPYGIAAVLRSPAPRRAALRLAAGGVVGCLLAAPLVLPFASILGQTERIARVRREPESIQAPRPTPANLSAFVFAHALRDRRSPESDENWNEVATQYVGFAAFALAVLASVRDPRRHRLWITAFAVFAVLAFYTGPLERLPVVGVTGHGRARFVVAFVVTVLAARGFDRVRSPALRRVLPLVLIADLALTSSAQHPPVSRVHAYPETPAIAHLRARSGGGGDHAPRAHDSAPRTAREGPYRVLGLATALTPNTGAMAGLETVSTHDPAAFEPYGRLLEQAGYDRRYYFSVWHRLPPKPLLDRLGVRYVIAPPTLLGAPLPLVYRGSDAVILENADASERFDDPSGVAEVTLERYGRNDARVRVSAPRPVRVRSAEIALPGWRLYREREPWPLEHEGLFLTWSAPAGDSRFELRYRPVGFRTGAALAAIGLLLVLLLLRAPSAGRARGAAQDGSPSE